MKPKLSLLPSLILTVVILGGLYLFKKFDSGKSGSAPLFTTRIGATSLNASNHWHSTFGYMNGRVSGYLIAKSDQSQLIMLSNLEEGKITYRLYDQAGTLQYTFPVGEETDTLRGALESGKRYTISVTAEKAKGSFDFKVE